MSKKTEPTGTAEASDRDHDPGTILVTGGTGTLGRHLVPLLRDSGNRVRVLSRRARTALERSGAVEEGIELAAGDLSTGAGIDAAVEGAGTVVHLAGSNKGDEGKARNLVEAASRAGARHLVYISVVGADRIPVESRIDRAMFGYFGSKLAAERVVASSGLPWTTLRATQFHDLMLSAAEAMAKLPAIPAPTGFRVQPVEAMEVAARMAELSLGPPSGLVAEMAGPEVLGVAGLMRAYLKAAGRRRPILPLPVPGRAARAFREGGNLAPDRAVGRRTWEQFLAARAPR